MKRKRTAKDWVRGGVSVSLFLFLVVFIIGVVDERTSPQAPSAQAATVPITPPLANIATPAAPLAVATQAAEVDSVAEQVTQQMEQQYQFIVRSNGSLLDLCAQAGMVKAAQLQAGDQPGYQRWSDMTREACGLAEDWRGKYSLTYMKGHPEYFSQEWVKFVSDGVQLGGG